MNALKALLRHKALLLVSLFMLALLALPLPAHAMALEEGQTIDNGIPVVYLNIDENQGSIDDMHTSPDHSAYCYGTMSIYVPEGFHYADFEDVACESIDGIAMSIRGRGNSTWLRSNKKPYKIKLDTSTDVLGLGKNKHWVLLANSQDMSLLKDRVTAWLGDEMGFSFTPRGVPVDVVIIGQNYGTVYLGSYYLSENVRVGTNRLEIEELKESDTDPDVITGGYLLQNGMQVDENSPDRFYTDRGVDWATHTPSFDTEGDALLANTSVEGEDGDETFAGSELGDAYKNSAQQEYIQNYIQQVEDILFSSETAYRDIIDMESAAKYWLIQEVSMNQDAYGSGSTYIYKYRGSDTLYWGPLWDFDFAYDYSYSYSEMKCRHEWLKPLLYDKSEGGFVDAVYGYWPTLRALLVELVEDGGLIDQYYEETKASAELDYSIWYPNSSETYYDAVLELKNWIKNRIAWLDENFDLINTLVYKVTFIVNGEEYAFDYKTFEEPVTPSDHSPEIDGYYFQGWVDEAGNLITRNYFIDGDTTLTAQLVADDEITHATDIAFNKYSDVINNSYFMKKYQLDFEIIPPDAVDKAVTWTTSDPTFATVDEYGLVTYKGPGTVVITGTLRNGVSRSFTLEITDDVIPAPSSIAADEAEITMAAGEQHPFSISTDPSPAKVYSYVYESEDESVVTVDEYGALTAVGPGTARVFVRAEIPSDSLDDVWLETYTTVTVTDGSEPEEVTYTVTGGADSTWTKGSSEGVTITVKRSVDDETCIDHFAGVELDGRTLTRDTDYTAVAGSTVVTLSPDTLEALDEGEHSVNVLFDDGEAETTLTVTAEEEGGAPGGDTPEPSRGDSNPQQRDNGRGGTPKAGDDSQALWPALLVCGLTALALALACKRSQASKTGACTR